MELNKEYKNYLFYLLIVIFIFFTILLILQFIPMKTEETSGKQLLQIVTMEGLKNKDKQDDSCVCDCNDDSTSNRTRRRRNRNGNNRDGNNRDGNNEEDGPNNPNELIPPEPLMLGIKDFFNTDLAKDFCKTFQTSSDKLEKQCNKLTNSNCLSSGCCVLLNGQKCVAGGSNGPTFQSGPSGSPMNIDYYYYQNKCYGNHCPKSPQQAIGSLLQ
jgi:hypothetical protein